MEKIAINSREIYLQTRRIFEQELESAITKNGGINLITPDKDLIGDISLAEPKGLYAVENFELLKIEAILQSVENGQVMAHILDYGLMHFDFDFVGSKSSCYKYLYKQEHENKIKVAELFTKHIQTIG